MWGDRTPFGNSPPDSVHVTLQPEQLRPGRILIVGDIHGCLLELNDLLKKCNYDPDKDNLILAGDIINKGPESVEVIKRAQELNAHVIRGNHEDACLALRRRFKLVSSISSAYKWLKSMSDQHIQYLEQLPFTMHIPSHHVTVVHAGFLPDGTPMREQSMKTMLFLEDVVQDPKSKKFKVYYKVKEEHQSWAAFWKGPNHVIFGHASGRTLQKHPFATGIDTGCVGGGHLTACVLPPASTLATSQEFQTYLTSQPKEQAPTREQLGAELVQVPCRHKQIRMPSTTEEDFTRKPSSSDFARSVREETEEEPSLMQGGGWGLSNSLKRWSTQVKSMPATISMRVRSSNGRAPAEV